MRKAVVNNDPLDLASQNRASRPIVIVIVSD